MSTLKFRNASEPQFKAPPSAEAEPEQSAGFVNETLEQVSSVVEATAIPVQSHLVELQRSEFLLPLLYALLVFAISALALRQCQKAVIRWRRRTALAADTPSAGGRTS